MDDLPKAVQDVLDSSMSRKLFDKAQVGEATYYLVDQSDEDGGETVIVRVDGGGKATVVDGILPEDSVSGGAGSSLSSRFSDRLREIRGDEDQVGDDLGGGAAFLDQETLTDRFLAKAEEMADDEFSSANAPGTDGGNLACAWAVNQVAKKALGRAIGGGLATAEMVKVLRRDHTLMDTPMAGTVIISPTVTRPNGTRNIGHVGVLGVINGNNVDESPIFSNSSSAAEFQQNFTLGRWRHKYVETKGLSLEIFELDPEKFPEAGAIS